VTLRTITPDSVVGVISACSGAVQTIGELTIDALSEG